MNKENIIVLSGTDDYFIKQRVSEYISDISIPDVNLTVINEINDITDERIVSMCQQLPFLGDDKSTIIIYGDLFKRDHPILQKYFADTNSRCLLVFVTSIDKRRSLYKVLEKTATIISFGKLDKKKFFEFTSKYFSSRGKLIDNSLVESIIKRIKYVETDDSTLLEVVSEYDRILSLVGNNNITLNEVQKINPLLDLNVFKFIGFLGRGKYTKALCFLQDLLSNEVNEFQVISLLLRHYRILLKLKFSTPENIGLSPFMMNEFQDIHTISEENIHNSLNLILKTQDNIKTGNISINHSLEELIVRLSLFGGKPA